MRKGGKDNTRKEGNMKNWVKYEGGGGMHHLRHSSGHRQPPTTSPHPHSTLLKLSLGGHLVTCGSTSVVVTWRTQVLLVVSPVVGSSVAVTHHLEVVGSSDMA